MPSPSAGATVTVYTLPLPVTDVITPLAVPVLDNEKSRMSTPVTFCEKVTVNCSLEALLVAALTVVMDVTVGADRLVTATPVPTLSLTCAVGVAPAVLFRLAAPPLPLTATLPVIAA